MERMPGSLTILVVDDDDDARSCAEDALVAMGERILSAASPKQALETLAKEKVDVVLCDIVMPGESGLSLLARVRATGNSVPFVFLTGFRDAEHINDALLLGAASFLEKPCEPTDIVDALWRAIEANRLSSVLLDTIDELVEELKPEQAEKLKRAKKLHGLLQADAYAKRRKRQVS